MNPFFKSQLREFFCSFICLIFVVLLLSQIALYSLFFDIVLDFYKLLIKNIFVY